MGDEFHQSNY